MYGEVIGGLWLRKYVLTMAPQFVCWRTQSVRANFGQKEAADHDEKYTGFA